MSKQKDSKKLYRSRKDTVIAGVCQGLSDYLDIDVVIIRVIFLIAALTGGAGVLVYLVMWIIVPKKSDIKKDNSQVVKKNLNEIKTKAEATAQGVKTFMKANVGQVKDQEIPKKDKPSLVGIILIVVGVMMLMDNFGFFSFGQIWPVTLILVGGYIVIR